MCLISGQHDKGGSVVKLAVRPLPLQSEVSLRWLRSSNTESLLCWNSVKPRRERSAEFP